MLAKHVVTTVIKTDAEVLPLSLYLVAGAIYATGDVVIDGYTTFSGNSVGEGAGGGGGETRRTPKHTQEWAPA